MSRLTTKQREKLLPEALRLQAIGYDMGEIAYRLDISYYQCKMLFSMYRCGR